MVSVTVIVLCIVHILHFFINLGIGGPLNVRGPWL